MLAPLMRLVFRGFLVFLLVSILPYVSQKQSDSSQTKSNETEEIIGPQSSKSLNRWAYWFDSQLRIEYLANRLLTRARKTDYIPTNPKVARTGVEPALPKELDPKSSAFANSTIKPSKKNPSRRLIASGKLRCRCHRFQAHLIIFLHFGVGLLVVLRLVSAYGSAITKVKLYCQPA